jgi:hypothetical protein
MPGIMSLKAIPKHLCAGLLFAVAASSVQAQNYSIDWYSIDGGGGTSSGGAYTLTGTIGQPDAGKLSGGDFELTGGFMSIVTAIQSPDGPLLSVNRSGANVVISWPNPSVGFTIEETTALGNPSSSTVWTGTSTTPVVVGENKQVTVPAPVGRKYYRLSNP